MTCHSRQPLRYKLEWWLNVSWILTSPFWVAHITVITPSGRKCAAVQYSVIIRRAVCFRSTAPNVKTCFTHLSLSVFLKTIFELRQFLKWGRVGSSFTCVKDCLAKPALGWCGWVCTSSVARSKEVQERFTGGLYQARERGHERRGLNFHETWDEHESESMVHFSKRVGDE